MRLRIITDCGVRFILTCEPNNTVMEVLQLINEKVQALLTTSERTANAINPLNETSYNTLKVLVDEMGFVLLNEDVISKVAEDSAIVIAKFQSVENEMTKFRIFNKIKNFYSCPFRCFHSIQCKPEKTQFRILLVRHGESLANVDPSVYVTLPEHKIPLSNAGKTMARGAGEAITNYFKEVFVFPHKAGLIRLWYSPYVRTFQTAQCIMDTAFEWITDMMEHPMLAELDYGLFEGKSRACAEKLGYTRELEHYDLRAKHSGRFWARYPLGESPFDVCIRMQLFFGTLVRDRESRLHNNEGINTVIIVTHGVTLRTFVKMWTHKSQEWYEKEYNPNNCAVRLITEKGGDEYYIFNGYDRYSRSAKPGLVECKDPCSEAKIVNNTSHINIENN